MAVRVAVWPVAMVPVVAVKPAVVAPEATVTDAGTVSAEELLVRATVAPPLGAACDMVTVQEPDEFCGNVVGLHVREDTFAGATRTMLADADVPL